MASFSMTSWVTHNPGFEVMVYLQIKYLKNGAF